MNTANTARDRSLEEERERALQRFTGEVYKHVHDKFKKDVPAVAEDVFNLVERTTESPFSATDEAFAIKEVLNRLSAQEHSKAVAAGTLDSSEANVPATVHKTHRRISEVTRVVSKPKPSSEVPEERPSQDGKLPHSVYLDAHTRELAQKLYGLDELRVHNPFNGHGGLEDTSQFEEEVDKSFETKVAEMVADGATSEEVSTAASQAIIDGSSYKEVQQAVQDAYNHNHSLRLRG